jgi:hypothetical protein
MGTGFGFTSWANPSGVSLTLSSSGLHGVSEAIGNLTDRANGKVHTSGAGGATAQWFAFDLGAARTLIVNRYTLKMRSDANTSLPVTWKLQRSNDGSSWTDIQTDTFTFTAANEVQDFAVAGETVGYRYFRLILTAVDSSGGDFFVLGEVELYGTLDYGAPISGEELAIFDSSNVLKPATDDASTPTTPGTVAGWLKITVEGAVAWVPYYQ